MRSPPTNKKPYESAKSPADVGVWKPNLPDRYLRNPSILFPIANTKSRPVDSRVCFLYARFIYKTKRLIAPQHNRLIVFNTSFSKLYRDVGIFSGQSNICQPFRQRCVLGHRLYKGSTFLFKATHHTSVSRERARCDRLYIPTRLLMYGNPAAESAAVV